MRHDLGVGETPHFRPHRLEGFVQPGIADGALGRLGDPRGEARARLDRGARLDQLRDGAPAQRGDHGFRQAEIGEADDLALVHRDAAENLREIFAQPDARQQLLGLAESGPRPTSAWHSRPTA